MERHSFVRIISGQQGIQRGATGPQTVHRHDDVTCRQTGALRRAAVEDLHHLGLRTAVLQTDAQHRAPFQCIRCLLGMPTAFVFARFGGPQFEVDSELRQ